MGNDASLGPWKKLEALRAKAGLAETPNVPPTAFTLAEYCERYQVCEKTARSQLDKLVRRGTVKRGMRYGHGADGRRMLVRVYWVT